MVQSGIKAGFHEVINMTNKEAKEILLQIMYDGEYPTGSTEAFNKAILALERASICGRDYVKEFGKCPICIDCPDNCPLDK